jgi:hypothetical protein
MPENTAFAHWDREYARPAQDILDLKAALANGEIDFAEFEIAS